MPVSAPPHPTDIESTERDGAYGDYMGGPDTPAKNFAYVKEHATRGDPASVLAAMDAFAARRGGLMHIGGPKAEIVVDRVLAKFPKPASPSDLPIVMVELGTFMGYSAVRFASALRAVFGAGNFKYVSFEVDPVRVDIARELLAFAGLSDVVTVVLGPLGDHVHRLRAGGDLGAPHGRVDLVFLDHWKDLYPVDAKLLLDQEKGLLRPGATLVADNVIKPGAPEYLEYVRKHPRLQSELHRSLAAYQTEIEDGVEVSVVKSVA